ncbi:MAG: nucleoside deaminase [Aestuariivita sp.]|nr:nucleoside deaminase [Aestuariivita sp.]
MKFISYMDCALELAHWSAQRGEVPVGAVLVSPNHKVVASSGNRMRELNDPTAHAEILVLRERCRQLETSRLYGHDLYVTLEPCAMCAAAISMARIARLYFGAEDPKSGGVEHGARIFSHRQTHHKPEVYSGLAAQESADLLKNFFMKRRDNLRSSDE